MRCNVGRRKSTELARFNALCREHGVTYGQGVAMGLKLPERKKKESDKAAESAIPAMVTRKKSKWKAGPIDCVKLADLYNRGCSVQEIADGLGISMQAAYNRMCKLELPSNRTQGWKTVQNPEVTPEQLYERALAVEMPVVERRNVNEQTQVPLVGLCEECNPGVSGVEGTAVRST